MQSRTNRVQHRNLFIFAIFSRLKIFVFCRQRAIETVIFVTGKGFKQSIALKLYFEGIIGDPRPRRLIYVWYTYRSRHRVNLFKR